MEIIQGKKTCQMDQATLRELIAPYRVVMVDIGTGDGKFVYEQARKAPHFFCVGIDADRQNLVHYSRKIYRRPAKGGLPNVLYVIANAFNLPSELNQCADYIWIVLPWGSLLKGVVTADPLLLANIRHLARPGAQWEMLINYELRYEAHEIQQRGLPLLTNTYLEQSLAPQYAREHLQINAISFMDNQAMRSFCSSWAKRLGHGRSRHTLHLQGQIGVCC